MSSNFSPIEEPILYCRFCEKIIPAHLDRSIAKNGKTLEKNSIFEYYCTKCFKTTCFTGNDLLDASEPTDPPLDALRTYSPKEHYVVGEHILHPTYKEAGLIVGKENSLPSKIIVQFEKNGVKKLVEDLGTK